MKTFKTDKINNYTDKTKESVDNIIFIRNRLKTQFCAGVLLSIVLLFLSYILFDSNSFKTAYQDWKYGPFTTILDDIKSGGPENTSKSFYEIEIETLIDTGIFIQHSIGLRGVPLFPTSKEYVYFAIIKNKYNKQKSIIILKTDEITPSQIDVVKKFSGKITKIDSKIQSQIDSLDLGEIKNNILNFQIKNASPSFEICFLIIIGLCLIFSSGYILLKAYNFYTKIENNETLLNFQCKPTIQDSVKSELKQKSLKWIFPRTFLTNSFVVVDNIYDFKLIYIPDITYLRKTPQGNNRYNLDIVNGLQTLATIDLDENDLVFWENHIQKTKENRNQSKTQNKSFNNDNQADELILKSKSMLSPGSSYTLGDLADICKKASELAFFEHHISFSKRKQIEKLYYACYNDLFNTDSNKTDATDKLKEYFDGKILAINTFGIRSIFWAIEEENISGEEIFKLSVQKRFANVFPEFYEQISKSQEKEIDNINNFLIKSLIEEYHDISPNSFNVLFYLVLNSNKSLLTILKNDFNLIKSFVYNYQESYNIITKQRYGADILAHNALLSISLKESIGDIAIAITWFQNNQKKVTRETAIGIFLYTVKGHETAKSIALKSCQNIRPSEIEDLNHLLHFIAIWVAKNLSKQYFEEHFEHIMALDLFKSELNQFIESFDSTYQKWIESSNNNLNLGACILFKHFAGISEKSSLVNSEDNNDLEYILDISKTVDNMIIGVIEHFFYLSHSSINNESK